LKVAIHQPNYLPWIGFFQKMAMSDVFIILDNVQFSKGSFTQRTRVRLKEGWTWLTIPIEKQNHYKPINEVLLPRDRDWASRHRSTLLHSLLKCAHVDRAFIEDYYGREFKTLQEFNEFGIFYLKDRFSIKSRIVRASELGIHGDLKSTDLLVELIKKVGGDQYISGTGGYNYMDEATFAGNGIGLIRYEFKPFQYAQRWTAFEHYMSAIDLLFNEGEEKGGRLVHDRIPAPAIAEACPL
jgi:hypothetical protein